MELAITSAGFIVGIVVGLCGVGGGALMTPFLIQYGINPAVAVGTDLMYALFSKSTGAWLHHAMGSVRWRIVGILALGSIPSSIICLLLLGTLDARGWDYQWLIRGVVGITLVLTALAMLFLKRGGSDDLASGSSEDGSTGHRLYLTVLTGVLLGFLVTLTSIGAGAIGAAVLILLYPRLPTISIVGTDLAHAVPLLAVAALGHWQLGNVDFRLFTSLLPGVIPGVYIGTRLGAHLPEVCLRKGLAVVLLLIGGAMVMA